MGWKGLERNRLDYILTDLLPVELSELFSFRPFYDFLMKKEQQKVLSEIIENLKSDQAEGSKKLFNSWSTMPLKYNIIKGSSSLRQMSIIQPLSAINLYLFIECYQKDILNFFTKNNCYSIRYHKKNSDLYYKSRKNSSIEYFSNTMRHKIGKAFIQQVGNFFRITKFESINSFSDSRLWRMANFNFKYYAKIDYKSCFDSIYSHVYKWIIERNIIDSKDAKNSNLFVVIDRILQNINGKQSNGLIVGPEFSRMIAEVLLQKIDNEVNIYLLKNNLEHNKNYKIFRYVDDIFIFSNSQENLEKITNTFSSISSRYLLNLNELKLIQGTTPCLPKIWLERTRNLADVLDGFFENIKKDEYNNLPEEDKFIVKKDYFPVDRIKDEIITLMNNFQHDRRTIVSFLLSALLNNISKKKNGYRIFQNEKSSKAFLIIDLALFIYSFSSTFDSTRKIISILVYLNDEFHFSDKNNKNNENLKKTIQRYAFIFQRGNISDICDWLSFLTEYCISLDIATERIIVDKIFQENNPIMLANILLYSEYHQQFFNEIKNAIESNVEKYISRISNKEHMLHTEFWHVLIFHNCPHISKKLRTKIELIIDNIKSSAKIKITQGKKDEILSAKATLLVCDFLKQNLPNGHKPHESFYNWNGNKNISAQITYRTLQRTIFKRYKGNRYGLYASLD